MSTPTPFNNRGTNIARFVDVVALLVKAPRTSPAISELTGYTRATVQGYLDALHGEGLVHVSTWHKPPIGPQVAVWAWQSAPFTLPDAVRPESSDFAARVACLRGAGERA